MAVTEPRSYAEIQRIRELQKEEARRAEAAARREAAIKQQAASQATERQSVLPPEPKSTVENAQEVLSARQPEQDPMMMPEQKPAPTAPNTESVALPKFPKSTSASAERIRQSRMKSASTEQALAMADAGFGDASVGGPQLKSVTDGKPDDLPTSEEARQDAADTMQEQDEQKANAEATTKKNYGDALQPAYQNFIQNLLKTNQMEMYRYYTGTDEVESEADETDPLVGGGPAAGMQRFIEDVLETDQNTNSEQMEALHAASKANDPRNANKVMDFDEDTKWRPGTDRQIINDARGTRVFQRQVDNDRVATNMFDPATGEPGIAGQAPSMWGDGRAKREGASAIYGPPGVPYKSRGMDMGDSRSGDAEANYTLSLMTRENWENLNEQDRRDLVMNLATRLGYLDGIKQLPEEDQYYEAKRAVFTHIFQTGDGETAIWANDEADLGYNSNLIDPNKKPLRVNEYDDNTGQWVLNQSQDSRDRARLRGAAAFASRGMKGHYQIDNYMNPDGTMNEEAAGAKILEVINRERVNMGQDKVESYDELSENGKLAYDQAMRQLYDMPQHARVKQNNLDQGRGQMMMGHHGRSWQWRQLGAYQRELDAAETLAEKAEIARKYGNRLDMTRYDQGANAQADRDAAAQAAALAKKERDEQIQQYISEKQKDRDAEVEKTRLQNPPIETPYYERLGAAESPEEAMIIHRGELSNQLDSIKDENGFFTYEDVMNNNKIIGVLNNMYLHPDMGRTWWEWFKGENEDELNAESYQMHLDNYVARVISDLGFNAPNHEEDRKKMTAFLTQNFNEKFREVNPRLAAKILSMVANQSGGESGEDAAQGGQAQTEGQGQAQMPPPNTNGKPVQGPEGDSLPKPPTVEELGGTGKIVWDAITGWIPSGDAARKAREEEANRRGITDPAARRRMGI